MVSAVAERVNPASSLLAATPLRAATTPDPTPSPDETAKQNAAARAAPSLAAAPAFTNGPPLSGATLLEAQQPDRSEEQPKDPNTLSPAQEEVVQKLRERDAEVRRHEQAHAQVGGQYASAPSYDYQTGPDNKQYAVGGEVQIDASPVPGDPEATIAKLEIVKRAALAPAEPSAQDRKVAALADQTILQAQAELLNQTNEERVSGSGGVPGAYGTLRGATSSDAPGGQLQLVA